MRLSEKKAKELFLNKYPTGYGIDFAGREMDVNYYGEIHSKYGWNIDHILPLAVKIVNSKGNLQCTNIITNTKKSDYTTWHDNGNNYQVKKVKFEEKTYVVEKIV